MTAPTAPAAATREAYPVALSELVEQGIDVVAGNITMTIETVSPIIPHVKSGRLKPLGVTATRRSSMLGSHAK